MDKRTVGVVLLDHGNIHYSFGSCEAEIEYPPGGYIAAQKIAGQFRDCGYVEVLRQNLNSGHLPAIILGGKLIFVIGRLQSDGTFEAAAFQLH